VDLDQLKATERFVAWIEGDESLHTHSAAGASRRRFSVPCKESDFQHQEVRMQKKRDYLGALFDKYDDNMDGHLGVVELGKIMMEREEFRFFTAGQGFSVRDVVESVCRGEESQVPSRERFIEFFSSRM